MDHSSLDHEIVRFPVVVHWRIFAQLPNSYWMTKINFYPANILTYLLDNYLHPYTIIRLLNLFYSRIQIVCKSIVYSPCVKHNRTSVFSLVDPFELYAHRCKTAYTRNGSFTQNTQTTHINIIDDTLGFRLLAIKLNTR